MKPTFFAVLFSLMLAGCGSISLPQPTMEAFSPAPTNVEAAVKVHFEDVLFDPFTAHYRIGHPYKAFLRRGLLFGGGIQWQGWAVDVEVNAKNRMGGYTGWQTYHVMFVAEHVAAAIRVDETPTTLWNNL